MEKENVGKGKERVLREKICNRVLEEQNMEKENVGKGRGRGRVLHDKFCNHVSERFHNGSKVEKALGLGFMVELYA